MKFSTTCFCICALVLSQQAAAHQTQHPGGDCNANPVICDMVCQDLLMQNEEAIGGGTCANHYPVGVTGTQTVGSLDCNNTYTSNSWNVVDCDGGTCLITGRLMCAGGSQGYSLSCGPKFGEAAAVTAKRNTVKCIYLDGTGAQVSCGSNGTAMILFW